MRQRIVMLAAVSLLATGCSKIDCDVDPCTIEECNIDFRVALFACSEATWGSCEEYYGKDPYYGCYGRETLASCPTDNVAGVCLSSDHHCRVMKTFHYEGYGDTYEWQRWCETHSGTWTPG